MLTGSRNSGFMLTFCQFPFCSVQAYLQEITAFHFYGIHTETNSPLHHHIKIQQAKKFLSFLSRAGKLFCNPRKGKNILKREIGKCMYQIEAFVFPAFPERCMHPIYEPRVLLLLITFQNAHIPACSFFWVAGQKKSAQQPVKMAH